MTGSDSREGLSRSTAEGQVVGFVSDMSGQQGWRRRVSKLIAYVALAGVSAVGVGVVLTVRLLS